MTKYRLKDQELQKKLDDISGGYFSDAMKGITIDGFKVFPNPIPFRLGDDGPVAAIQLLSKDIEPYIEYDPNDWNPYPEVMPPEGVLMRIEGRFEDCIFRCSAVFKEGIWCSEDEVPEKVKELGWEINGVKRFRPWE